MRNISKVEACFVCGEALTVEEVHEDIPSGEKNFTKFIVSPCSNVNCKTNTMLPEGKKPQPSVRTLWHINKEDLSSEKVGIKIIDDRPPRRNLYS